MDDESSAFLCFLVEKHKEAKCYEPNVTVQGRTGAVALDRAIYHPETDDFVGETLRRLKFVLLLPLSSRKFIAPPKPTNPHPTSRQHYCYFSKVNLFSLVSCFHPVCDFLYPRHSPLSTLFSTGKSRCHSIERPLIRIETFCTCKKTDLSFVLVTFESLEGCRCT